MATTYKLTGTILRQTSKALQMLVSEINGVPLDEDEEQWFPFSQIDRIVNRKHDAESDEITVSEWILQQKEMI